MKHLLTAVLSIGMLFLGAASPSAEQLPQMSVKKTATCGCCEVWIKHLRNAGFKIEPENLPFSVLAKHKLDQGVPPELASCHTARVGGYVIEGHVPAREIKRLLVEKPDAIGLVVPGMPIGSPGMESGNTREAYDVLLLKKDGTTSVFAHYPAKG